METLKSYNDRKYLDWKMEFYKTNKPNGIECPKCKSELRDFDESHIAYGWSILTRPVICIDCNFRGEKHI